MPLDTRSSSTAALAVPVTGTGRVEQQATSRWLRGHVPGEAGIWIFILGDMTLYIFLFAGFMADRMKAVELFNQSASTLHIGIGGINTLLLLTSSLAVVFGVRAVRERIAKHAPMLFALAFLCAAGFVFNKYIEYSDLVGNGFTPYSNRFYLWYYILTGIHLTHLVAGMWVLVYLFRVAQKAQREEVTIRGVESGASFWHAVDLLWVVLFPLLYLMR
ncbi:MAG: cytochrome c oxidase subunit 3 [bacterium]